MLFVYAQFKGSMSFFNVKYRIILLVTRFLTSVLSNQYCYIRKSNPTLFNIPFTQNNSEAEFNEFFNPFPTGGGATN